MRSFRLRLLAWYGAIVLVVVGGSGAALYLVAHRAAFKELDKEIEARARSIAGALAAHSDDVSEWRLPQELARYFEPPRPHPRPQQPRPPGPGDRPYYIVHDGAGTVVDASHPDWDVPPLAPKPSPHDPHKLRWRDRDGWREAVLAGPHGTTVLVGRSTREVHRHMQTFLAQLCAIGTGALAVAMYGGWLLARKALAPIARITAAAETISSKNLSHRVPLEETDSELGRLASVLNGAFDRLEQALLRQVTFTADASHELRTPLAVLTAHLELALRRDRSPDYYRNTLSSCRSAAQRMEQVLQRLLTLARADAEPTTTRSQPVELQPLVEDVVSRLLPLALDRGIQCVVDGAPVRVRGDLERIVLLVENLVHNSIVHNRPEGTVTIRLAADGSSGILEVTDTGPGIPEADQPHVFERFYRVDKARSRESGGTGLGLEIVKRIVESHGGTVRLISEEGRGTTVLVTLPLLYE